MDNTNTKITKATRNDVYTEMYARGWNMLTIMRNKLTGIDAQAYSIGLILYRFLSEKLEDYINKDAFSDPVITEDGRTLYKYSEAKDEDVNEDFRKDVIDEIGFFLYPSELFNSLYATIGNEPDNYVAGTFINKLRRNLTAIEESSISGNSENFKGIFEDFDIHRQSLGVNAEAREKLLQSMMNAVAKMELGPNGELDVDYLGGYFEYLIGRYAANAGKSGGEYYTPAEVSMLLAKIGAHGKSYIQRAYDPTCGSAGLLLKARKVLGENNIGEFYGQELNRATYNYARANMLIHDIPFAKYKIANDDTLTHPAFMDKKFDLIVSNPPYSVHWDPESAAAKGDERFTPASAFAPKTKADFAFIMHSLHLLKANGTAAIVVFPGILYRGSAEATIRQYLVNENVVDAVIQLPSKLFYGTSIATCILVLKKNRENNCRDTIFIDASKYSTKASKNDYLSDENIEDIYKLYADRKDVDHIAKVVSIEDMQKAEYNLSVSTYVEPEDTAEKIDIKALNAEIDQIVTKENELRAKIKEIIARIEGIGNED